MFRVLKLFSFSALIIILAGMMYNFTPRTDVRKNKPEIDHSPHLFEVIDLNYESFNNGNRTISFKADRFSIQRKKIGFFRVGLVNMGVFDNADVVLHLQHQGNDYSCCHESSEDAPDEQSLPDLSKMLPPHAAGRISSVTLKPVILSLVDGNSVLTRITSESAELRLTGPGIEFTGNVEVVSEDKTLKTRRLIFYPDDFYLEITGGFVLEDPEARSKGEGIILDIRLNPVEHSSRTEIIFRQATALSASLD